MGDEIKILRCDLNTSGVERSDGKEEIHTLWVEGLELRERVRLQDEDWYAFGYVSGFLDYGRGRFVAVEIE